jgi:hypothetical protein
MAITSADPDNNPATPRPSISFGSASGGGSQSLRAEFPADTGSSSLSEYYRGGSVVPTSSVVGGEQASEYGSNQLIESRYATIGSGSGTLSEINNSAPEYLFYVRKVKSSSAPVPPIDTLVEHERGVNEWRINYNQSQGGGAYIRIFYEGNVVYTGSLIANNAAESVTELTVNVSGTSIVFAKGVGAPGYSYEANFKISTRTSVAVGDLLFAWQYETTDADDKHGYTFKIPNGNVGEEYEHTDGYTYTTGPDASGVTVLLQVKGEPDGFHNPNLPPSMHRWLFEYRNQPVYNTWYDRYYIKRRTTANASNSQTVLINNLVPTSGPISFSQLYGSRNFFEDSANIPGHSPTETSNIYIWEAQNFPASITTDGTDVRSGALSGATAYRDGPVPAGFTTYNVPMGTFYIDPTTFTGNIKLTLSPTDAATTDIRYYGFLDDDNGDAYVRINEVGIRIVNVDSGNDALLYKGEASPTFTGDGTSGNGRSITRFLSFNLANVRTDVSETITDTGRFIVYLTFGYNQPIAYGDADFSLSIDGVKVSWETA